jgi:iron complex outermembrane receptor protein
MLIKDKLRFTIGSKMEHNTYTGLQYQPNSRLTYAVSKRQTLWAAVSRAVRNPSRIDREFEVYLDPTFPLIKGTDSFLSESVIAYELGWRHQPSKKVSLSVSTFYNSYDNVRSAEPGTGAMGYPIAFGNGVEGEAYGMELSANAQVNKWWNLRGGYTFLEKDLRVKASSLDLNKATAESNDPRHQFLIQSNIQFPYHLQLGTVVRYVAELPKPVVHAYAGADIKIGWTFHRFLEVSVVGQNLLYNQHREFQASTPVREIQRSIYGKIACRF